MEDETEEGDGRAQSGRLPLGARPVARDRTRLLHGAAVAGVFSRVP